MPTQRTLVLMEGNDPAVTFKVRLDRKPWDLATAVVELIVKASRTTDDDDFMLFYSTAGASPRLVKQDPTSGGIVVADFAGQVPAPGKYWHRVTVTDNSRRTTVRYGSLKVVDT